MAINNKFATKYSQWVSQWKDKNVQKMGSSYDFVSSESTLLVSGPPEWDGDEHGRTQENDLIPIGLVQSASIGQQKTIQQLNEIGSRQLFTIPGRVYATASISRILFDGPSLLFAMSVYYSKNDGNIMVPNIPIQTETDPTHLYPVSDQPTADGYTEIGQAKSDMGALWGNLGSTIFNKPMGLGFVFYDTETQFYGGLYLEKCYIANYNIGVSAQQTILLENVQIRATRIRPIFLSGGVPPS